eukprot:15578803-Heterocapsa_arctica.AAC.1
MFIASAGKVAGLHTDTHECSWIEGSGDYANTKQLLKPLPVAVRPIPAKEGGGFRVEGLPAQLVHDIFTAH